MGKNILTKELLLKSVEEWNAAREANPDLRPDLCCAQLKGANLKGANLDWANLSEADLIEADLSNASLSEADLHKAFLWDANLSGANLSKSNLIYARLSGADLSSSNLFSANLSFAELDNANLSKTSLNWTYFNGADISGAKFTGAFTGHTLFGAVDLSKAIELETIRHVAPSTLGIDTIYASNGDMPDTFLRGCGLPDILIKSIHSLNPKASDYYSCFISHSSLDKVFVDQLYADLQEKGVPCYYAPHDLPIGAKTRLTIHEEIRNYDKLLLVLSEHSVKSSWVEDEVEHAFDLEKERGMPVLFPIRLDDAVMVSKTGWASSVRTQRNIGDFTDHDSYQKAFSRLLRDLKQ
jgi:uncharacterized protein YjbI with pentapeptide repeats